MGSRPDRWWNDRPAAQARLSQQIAEWCRERSDDDVIVVFDGRLVDAVSVIAGGNLRIEFASRPGRNAADHRVVELANEHEGARVVTADRGLIARLPGGTEVLGPRAFLDQLSA